MYVNGWPAKNRLKNGHTSPDLKVGNARPSRTHSPCSAYVCVCLRSNLVNKVFIRVSSKRRPKPTAEYEEQQSRGRYTAHAVQVPWLAIHPYARNSMRGGGAVEGRVVLHFIWVAVEVSARNTSQPTFSHHDSSASATYVLTSTSRRAGHRAANQLSNVRFGR